MGKPASHYNGLKFDPVIFSFQNPLNTLTRDYDRITEIHEPIALLVEEYYSKSLNKRIFSKFPDTKLASKYYDFFKTIAELLGIPRDEIELSLEQVESEITYSPEVTTFLEEHEFLKPILEEAPERIWKFFPGAKIEREVVSDPEAINSQTLVIFIYTKLSAEEAIEQMDLLDEDWFLEAYSKSECKICLDIIFE